MTPAEPAPPIDEGPAPLDTAAKRRRNVRAAVASVILIGAFVWILTRGGFPLFPHPGWFGELKLAHVAAFWVSILGHVLIRCVRCHFLYAPLAKIPLRRTITINAIGMAFITFLPLRLGEVARPAMLREKGGLSAWAVTGTVGAERILDGIVFSIMLLVGLALAAPQSPLPDHVGALPVPVWIIPQTARAAALVFAAAFLVMAAFYFLRSTARRITERVVGLVSSKLATQLADIVEHLSDGLRFLTNLRYSVPYLAITLLGVFCQIWAFYQLARGVGLPPISLAQSTVVLGVLALGFSAPNAPGFFGMVQLALYAGLATYVPPAMVAREGGTFVFIFYTTHLINVSVLAALALLVDMRSRANTPEPGPAV